MTTADVVDAGATVVVVAAVVGAANSPPLEPLAVAPSAAPVTVMGAVVGTVIGSDPRAASNVGRCGLDHGACPAAAAAPVVAVADTATAMTNIRRPRVPSWVSFDMGSSSGVPHRGSA
jgi:hypothetical protein